MPAALQVIRDPEAAASALDPVRLALLEKLREPNSAAGLARAAGLPRQKLNYHLRQLESQGLVEFVEERRKGNCLERIVRATARQYLISPETLGAMGTKPEEARDRFSAAYLAAVSGRTIRDLAAIRRRADAEGKRVATLTLESEVRFASAESRAAFAEELTQAITHLIAKYHDTAAAKGRNFRLVVGAYPKPPADAGESDKRAANME